MFNSCFFKPTYYTILKSIKHVFFCLLPITILLQKKGIFFTYNIRALKKYLTAKYGVTQ